MPYGKHVTYKSAGNGEGYIDFGKGKKVTYGNGNWSYDGDLDRPTADPVGVVSNSNNFQRSNERQSADNTTRYGAGNLAPATFKPVFNPQANGVTPTGNNVVNSRVNSTEAQNTLKLDETLKVQKEQQETLDKLVKNNKDYLNSGLGQSQQIRIQDFNLENQQEDYVYERKNNREDTLSQRKAGQQSQESQRLYNIGSDKRQYDMQYNADKTETERQSIETVNYQADANVRASQSGAYSAYLQSKEASDAQQYSADAERDSNRHNANTQARSNREVADIQAQATIEAARKQQELGIFNSLIAGSQNYNYW